jgi:diaminopimelate decarboxylase
MDYFQYRSRTLYCEELPIPELAARYGTPLFVYSQKTLLHHLSQLQTAFAPAQPLICYSIKTNANLHICRLLRAHGAGFDVTSGGELYRALKAGGAGEKIVFAGVGKTEEEIRQGIEAGVLMFNVESDAELALVAAVAQEMQQVVRIVKTTTGKRGVKFGMDWDRIVAIAGRLLGNRWVKLSGLHMHLGSPILTTAPYAQALERAVPLIKELRAQGHDLLYLNCGGGFGIHYRKQEALPAEAFAAVILPAALETGCKLILEPGRYIAGNACVLVSRVIYPKESGGRNFIIQDAGMNDLIRPTLYEAFHRIWPVQPPAGVPEWPADFEQEIPGTRLCDVVGPICESGDYLAQGRYLPLLQAGDLLATFSAGAYGMAMASNYNGRRRAAEVLVDEKSARLIRRRETFEDLVRTEEEVS